MPVRDLVVVAASAGGVEALREFVAGLPADLAASVLVVLHTPPEGRSALPAILSRAGALPAEHPIDGQPLRHGRIYIAPPDHHLLVDREVVRLTRGPRENRVRPAADPLFRTAARWCGPRSIGVVLSGALDDGAAGLAAIVSCGGVGLAQDPKEALFAGMPRAALAAVPDTKLFAAAQLGAAIAELVGQPVSWPPGQPDRDLILEADMAVNEKSATDEQERPGQPAAVACPECRGGMYKIETGNTVHYRCHVGHSYSPQTLIAAQTDNTESALWTAASILAERALIHQELAARAGKQGLLGEEAAHLAAVEEAETAVRVIRNQVTPPSPATYEHGGPRTP
jgi:two-component system chemotaxis response regulator CheB